MKKLIILTLTTLILCSALYAGIYGKVSGKVVNEDGEGLIGATVMVVGTTRGTCVNDPDGSFKVINIKPGKYDIKVSFVSMKSKLLKNLEISADTTIKLGNLILEEDEKFKGDPISLGGRPLVSRKTIGTMHRITLDDILNTP